jgi:GT2 family glycosyltransferase
MLIFQYLDCQNISLAHSNFYNYRKVTAFLPFLKNMKMRLSACITTRNRTEELDACLCALWNSTVKPYSVVVSDDSSDSRVQEENRQVVDQYPGTTYIKGPQVGVCANRNNAVNAINDSEVDLVTFTDDDICVEPDFIAIALEQFSQIPTQERCHTILSGLSRDPNGNDLLPGKLNFRGYFTTFSNIPETVAIHAAVFPRAFFKEEQWDENIFFGYEDAELCLRAIKRGYRIQYFPDLKVLNTAFQKGTLNTNCLKGLNDYDIYIESARLYVGVKRYKCISPNFFKLFSFLLIYASHMTIYLWRKEALSSWPLIVQNSRIQKLFGNT